MATTTTPLIVKVKKEIPSDEIKEFAETAMNELLGWYGYSNVDRSEMSKYSRTVDDSMDINKQKPTTVSITSRPTNSSTPDRYSSHSPENSKSPILRKIIDKKDSNCGWCKRPVTLNSPEFLVTPEGPRYCTETCFSQSRRASFKRAKTCDWCKHIRHAVSYVDFYDGASQLQFCSDKCLNQYKMQIFCKETQAHLDMNPHLKDKGSANDGGLITPDLWLKNCKSRSTSPSSDRSKSISPVTKPSMNTSSNPSHRPLITVTPSAKLLSRPSAALPHVRISPKLTRKRRSLRLCASSSNSDSLEVTNNNSVVTSCTNPINATSCHEPINNLHKQSPHKEPVAPLKQNSTHHFLPPPPNLFPIRHSGLPGTSRFVPQSQSHAQQQPVTNQLPQNTPSSSSYLPNLDHHTSRLLGANPPPVTILVPYPIILPVPIPIPIPMPIIDFLRAAQSKLDERNKNVTENGNETRNELNDEQPLDFTKSRSECMPTLTQQLQQLNKPNETQQLVEKDEHQITISGADRSEEVDGQEQRLPKFKITRLASKRVISTKESESSRPLRKRKRVIDCDYSRLRDDDKKKF